MVWNVWNHISPFQYIFPMKKHGLIKEWRNSACKINYKQVCRRKKRALFKLGASEVIANLYCNCVHLHWEGCVICSLYLRQHMKRSIWSGSIFSWGGAGGMLRHLLLFMFVSGSGFYSQVGIGIRSWIRIRKPVQMSAVTSTKNWLWQTMIWSRTLLFSGVLAGSSSVEGVSITWKKPIFYLQIIKRGIKKINHFIFLAIPVFLIVLKTEYPVWQNIRYLAE